MYKLEHACTLACAEVYGFCSCMFKDVLYCAEVTPCKVYNVDIVTDACTVNRFIVIAENVKVWELSYRYLCDIRHKVVGDTVRIFTEKSAFVCAYRVEVTEE